MNAAVKPVTDRTRALRQEQMLTVLEPIARLARRSGFSAPELLGLVREAILSATRADLEEWPDTAARTAIESGLTRSDVQHIAALKEHRDSEILAGRRIKQIAGRVATAWTKEPRCSAPYGCALPIAVSRDSAAAAAHEDRLTFDELVRLVEPSADWRTVLAALLEAGTASWTDESQQAVALSTEFASVLEQDGDTTFWYVTSTLAGLARTLATNAYDLYPGPKLFERRARADQLRDEETLQVLNERLRAKLSSALESVIGDLDKHEDDSDSVPAQSPGLRACVGMYVMVEPNDQPIPNPPSAKSRRMKTIDLASPTISANDV